MIKGFILLCSILITSAAFAQSPWKMVKDEDNIKVFHSMPPGARYKNIRVEATMEGTFDKLITVINNFSQYKDWMFNNKTAYLLKRISLLEFYYYTETSLPWPASNRDAAVYMKIDRDKQNKYIKINEVSVPNFVPEKEGKVRVPRSVVNWTVTAPTATTIKIVYFFDADPGGSLPDLLVNTFADKGHFETFKKLKKVLKK